MGAMHPIMDCDDFDPAGGFPDEPPTRKPRKAIRPIRVEGDVAYVPLTRGYEAIIDAADVDLVAGRNWIALVEANTAYAARTEDRDGKRVTVGMHRVIMSAPSDKLVDHIDGDGLNNRRANMRLASKSENGRNAKKSRRNTSGYKGVRWNKVERKWYARIVFNRKEKHLGAFLCPKEAHEAYCKAARDLFGEFARSA